jgi:hypothetical protein
VVLLLLLPLLLLLLLRLLVRRRRRRRPSLLLLRLRLLLRLLRLLLLVVLLLLVRASRRLPPAAPLSGAVLAAESAASRVEGLLPLLACGPSACTAAAEPADKSHRLRFLRPSGAASAAFGCLAVSTSIARCAAASGCSKTPSRLLIAAAAAVLMLRRDFTPCTNGKWYGCAALAV